MGDTPNKDKNFCVWKPRKFRKTNKTYTGKIKYIIKTCLHCGEQFESYNGLQKYCKDGLCIKERKINYQRKFRQKLKDTGRKHYYRKYYDKLLIRKKARKGRHENAKELYKKHISYNRKRARDYNKKKRIDAMIKISNGNQPVCFSCGCDVIEFLEINHISPGLYHLRGGCQKTHSEILNGIAVISNFDIRCKLCNWFYHYELKFPHLKGRYKITFT